MKLLVKPSVNLYDYCTFNCSYQNCSSTNSCNYDINPCPTKSSCTCLSYVGCRYAE